MSITKFGRQAAIDLSATTNTLVWKPDSCSNNGNVSVIFSNRNGSNVQVRLAIVDGDLADLSVEDWIEYDTVIEANGVLGYGGLSISRGHSIIAYSDTANVCVSVHGVEDTDQNQLPRDGKVRRFHSRTAAPYSACNIGAGGVGVFDQLSGYDFQFRNINAGSNKISVTDDSANDEIDIDVNEGNLTLSNIGGSVTDSQVPNTITLDNITQITARSHTDLSDIGSYTHVQIDSHINDSTLHFTEASIDHGSISGLTDDDHSQYALLAGRSGGQTLYGGTDAGDDLTLESTSNATKGVISIISDTDFNGVDADFDNTTNSNQVGVITKNGTKFIHDFNYGNNGTVTTDGFNVFIGEDAGNFTMGSTATSTIEGSYNTGVGHLVLYSATTGYQNTGIGRLALYSSTTGYLNTGVGHLALYSNTTGYRNIGIGNQPLYFNTTGYRNIGIGDQAGRYITSGSNNQTSDNSIYLGYDTRASADGNTNEIVIGANARGAGSNSITLGDSNVATVSFPGLGTSATAGASAGYITLKIGGTDYKIEIFAVS